MDNVSSQDPTPTPQQKAEQQAEAARIQEVTLLLTHLFDREQATIKAVLGCLYDVGTVNFINERISARPLRPLARPILKWSKPVFTFIGYRWFLKNCPPLITGWLRGKVKAQTSRRPKKTAPPRPPTPVGMTVEYTLYQVEIRRLRSRVRWVTVALAGVSATLVVVMVRPNLTSVEQLLQLTQASQTKVQQTEK